MDERERALRAKFTEAEQIRVDVLGTLHGYSRFFRSLADILDGCRQDGSMQATPPVLPGEVPLTARVQALLDDLQQAVATKTQCQAELRAAGYPPAR